MKLSPPWLLSHWSTVQRAAPSLLPISPVGFLEVAGLNNRLPLWISRSLL